MQDHIDLLFDEICSTLATRFIMKIGLCSKAHFFNRRITNMKKQYLCYRYTYPSTIIDQATRTKQYHWVYETILKYPDPNIITSGIIIAIDHNDKHVFDIMYDLYLDLDKKESLARCLKQAIWKRNKYFIEKLVKHMTPCCESSYTRAAIITQLPMTIIENSQDEFNNYLLGYNGNTITTSVGVKNWIWNLLGRLSNVNLDIPDINIVCGEFKTFQYHYSETVSSSVVKYIAEFFSFLLENKELQIHFIPRYKFLVEFYNTTHGSRGFNLLLWNILGEHFIQTNFMTLLINHSLFDEFINTNNYKLSDRDQAIVFWHCRDLNRVKQLCTKYALYYFGIIAQNAKYTPQAFHMGHDTLGLNLTDYRKLTISKLEWLASNPDLCPVIDEHPSFSRLNLNLDELDLHSMLRICQYQDFNDRINFFKSLFLF